jgi:hypothetical protein
VTASKPRNLQKDHLQLEATRSIVHGRNLKRIAKKGKCKKVRARDNDKMLKVLNE